MKRTVLLTLIFVIAGGAAMAHQHRGYQQSDIVWRHSQISCETVRVYVMKVGLVEATTMARAEGMTAAQERWARRCLGK